MTDTPDTEVREAKLRDAFDKSTHATTDSVQAEEKRKAAVAEAKPTVRNDKMIAALLREREGLVATGKTERVAQVDEQLKHFGYEGEERKSALPQGRTAKVQTTT